MEPRYWIYHTSAYLQLNKFDIDIEAERIEKFLWFSLWDASRKSFQQPEEYKKDVGYKVKEGDILKFGWVKMLVKRINLVDEQIEGWFIR